MVVQVQGRVNIEFFLLNRPRAPAFLAVKGSYPEFTVIKVNNSEHCAIFVLSHLIQFDILIRFASKFFLKSYILTLKIIHHNKELEFAIFHDQNSPCRIFGELATDNWSVCWDKGGFYHILEYVLVVDEPVVGLHNDLLILVVHHRDSKILVKRLLLCLIILIGAFLRFVIIEESHSRFKC